MVKLDYQALNRISFGIYQQLLDASEMQQINQRVQEIDQQSLRIRTSKVILFVNTHKTMMQENTILVSKAGELRAKQQ